MSKVIQGQNWDLTPSADGRRYSKFSDGAATFAVSASTPANGATPAYQIYDPDTATWGAWIAGDDGLDLGGVVTSVVGAPITSGLAFDDSLDAALDTVVESNAIVISSQGHQLRVRRRASINNSQTRALDAWINGVAVRRWNVTTVAAAVPPPSGDFPGLESRQDILLNLNYSSVTSDLYNPPWTSSGVASPAIDGWRTGHIADTNKDASHISAEALALPHYEVRTGVHCLPGQARASICTVYPPNYVPLVDYNNGSVLGTPAGRSRIDAAWVPAMAALFSPNSPRYGVDYGHENGFYEEFWYCQTIYLPSNFQWDAGPLANLSFLEMGNPGHTPKVFEIAHPALSSGADPRWTLRAGNWDDSGSTNHLNWILSWSQVADMVGHFNFWVINFKADPRAGASGFLRVWHHTEATSPQLIWDFNNVRWGLRREHSKYGISAGGQMAAKAFSCYKGGMHNKDSNGNFVYSGAVTAPLSIGFPWTCLGGDQSNFESVHPLRASP